MFTIPDRCYTSMTPSTIGCTLTLSYVHHNVIQRLAFQVGHCGVRGGIANGKQHQQLLVGWTFQEEPDLGAAVQGRRRDRDKAHVLMGKRAERTGLILL